MSLAQATQRNLGILKETIYNFTKVGDEVPRHAHGDHDKHITIVTKGCIRAEWWYEDIYGDERLYPGDDIIWPPGVEHKLSALSANSQIRNIVY